MKKQDRIRPKILGVFLQAFLRLFKEDFTYRASGLVYTTLLSIVPFFVIMLFFLQFFPFFNDTISFIKDHALTYFLPSTQNVIVPYLILFINQAAKLPTISILFFVITVILLISSVNDSLNAVNNNKQCPQKKSSFILRWTVLIIVPFIMGLSIILSVFLFSLASKAPFFISVFPLIVDAFILSVIYLIVLNFKVSYLDSIFAGIISAILLELAKKGFSFYINNFADYQLIYGALATIPIFLVWLYISWLIILFGALLIHEKTRRSN